MEMISLSGKYPASLQTATLVSAAPDGTLYLPANITPLPKSVLDSLPNLSFTQLADVVFNHLLNGMLPSNVISDLVADAFNFPIELVKVTPNTYVLELFHGPSGAFKDFGARFMSNLAAHFLQNSGKQVNVLVATSGDTGGAVAAGFFNRPNIKVHVLFPNKKVSPLQQRQLTTWGNNISAIAIDGMFDDCQRLVKTAFADAELNNQFMLSSANSINIARLLPQLLYFLYAQSRVGGAPAFATPSGNFGNLTGGLIAKLLGMPVANRGLIAANNSNNVFIRFLQTGQYNPLPAVPTISNAMDVGNPNNFPRMVNLVGGEQHLAQHFWGDWFTDDVTKQTMLSVYNQTQYMLEPHTAVGWAALQNYRNVFGFNGDGIVLGTAHPAKFPESIIPLLGVTPKFPPQFDRFELGTEQFINLSSDYNQFKDYLLAQAVR